MGVADLFAGSGIVHHALEALAWFYSAMYGIKMPLAVDYHVDHDKIKQVFLSNEVGGDELIQIPVFKKVADVATGRKMCSYLFYPGLALLPALLHRSHGPWHIGPWPMAHAWLGHGPATGHDQTETDHKALPVA